MPTAVLFNGGVFKAEPIRARVLDLLASWNGGQPVRELARLRAGPRRRAGRRHLRASPRHRQGHAHQGRRRAVLLYRPGDLDAGHSRAIRPPVKALCVVPQGMQEGTELLIEGRDVRPGDRPRPRSSGSSPPPCAAATRRARSCPTPNVSLEETGLLEVEIPALCPTFRRDRWCRCRSTPSSRNSARSNSG